MNEELYKTKNYNKLLNNDNFSNEIINNLNEKIIKLNKVNETLEDKLKQSSNEENIGDIMDNLNLNSKNLNDTTNSQKQNLNEISSINLKNEKINILKKELIKVKNDNKNMKDSLNHKTKII